MKDAELRGLFEALTKENAVTRQVLHEEITGTRDELRGEIAGTRDELRSEIAGTRDELRAEIAGTREHLHGEIAATRHELGFLIEELADRIQFVGEAVQMTSERLTRETQEIRAEMAKGFEETHALVRFAYKDLTKN
jgi:hypothetical protein